MCACLGYRRLHPAAILDIEVEHGGWGAITESVETAEEASARVARFNAWRAASRVCGLAGALTIAEMVDDTAPGWVVQELHAAYLAQHDELEQLRREVEQLRNREPEPRCLDCRTAARIARIRNRRSTL
jgi:hypothetical protein